MQMRNGYERAAAQGGQALALLLHVLLVLLVLGQVVFLASRYRVRVDMTSDKLWTSTDSTRSVLSKLDKRLLVEAYFSPKDDLPLNMRGTRDWAGNFLDEEESRLHTDLKFQALARTSAGYAYAQAKLGVDWEGVEKGEDGELDEMLDGMQMGNKVSLKF